MSAVRQSIFQVESGDNSQNYLIFSDNRRINVLNINDICNFILRIKDMLSALRDTFKSQNTDGISRRNALRLGLGGLAATALASLPYANKAEAGEANAATPSTPLEYRDEMAKYSRDPKTQGIGVFINLQENATLEQGQELGDWLKNAFASRNVPVEYRINQSRGTATDLTFYVKGYDFPVNVGNLKTELPKLLAHHQGAWLPEQVSANTQPQ